MEYASQLLAYPAVLVGTFLLWSMVRRGLVSGGLNIEWRSFRFDFLSASVFELGGVGGVGVGYIGWAGWRRVGCVEKSSEVALS